MSSYSDIISSATKENVDKMRKELRALEKNESYLAASLYLDTIVASDDSLYNEIYKAIFTLPSFAIRAVLSSITGGRLARLDTANLKEAISLIHEARAGEDALAEKSFYNGIAKRIKKNRYNSKPLDEALNTLISYYPRDSYSLFLFLHNDSKNTKYLEAYFKKFLLMATRDGNKLMVINSISYLFNVCRLNKGTTLADDLMEAGAIESSIEISELISFMRIVALGFDGSDEERDILIDIDPEEYKFDIDRDLIYISFLKEKLEYYLNRYPLKYSQAIANRIKDICLGNGSAIIASKLNDMEKLAKKAILSYNNGSLQKFFENFKTSAYGLSFDLNRLELLIEGNTVYLIKDKKYECECEFIKYYKTKDIVSLGLKLPILTGSNELVFKRKADGLHYLGSLDELYAFIDDDVDLLDDEDDLLDDDVDLLDDEDE